MNLFCLSQQALPIHQMDGSCREVLQGRISSDARQLYNRLMDHIESVAGITQLGDCLIRAAMSIEKYMACRQQFLAYLKLSAINAYALDTRARRASL